MAIDPNELELGYHPAYLDHKGQRRLLSLLRDVIDRAPLYVPQMPRTGNPFSVRMTNCGPLGWLSDRAGGYRYEKTHPENGRPWPPMPQMLLDLWGELAGYPLPPEACLVNYYSADAKMGQHRDEDEQDAKAPVLSISLGDTALFRLGGLNRRDPTRSFRLRSGDIVILRGPTRLAYHGIDRLYPGSSDLVEEGGRFNLTLRRVTCA